MIDLNFDEIRDLFLRHGFTLHDNFNIFGLRNETRIEDDIFNDKIVVTSGGKIHVFNATVDPGVYYTNNPGKVKGVAHLCLGQYKNAYVIGKHKGYTALCQWGNEVTVWRDLNRNFKHDNTDRFDSGYFGINIHRAHSKIKAENIGKYSAGCQVIQSPEDFKKLMELVFNSPQYKEHGAQAGFTYTLFSGNEVEL